MNQARLDDMVHLAAVPAEFEVFYDQFSSGYLLASGFDADGQAELMLYLRTDNGHLVVFHNGDGNPPAERNYVLTLRPVASNSFNANGDHPTHFRDLLSTAWVTAQPQVRRVRCWVRDGSYDRTSVISPNKTNNIQVRPWDERPLFNLGGNSRSATAGGPARSSACAVCSPIPGWASE